MPDEVETGPDHVVKVQQNVEGEAIDEYTIEGGMTAFVVSGEDRELFINKGTSATDVEFVAMYGQNLWLRAWIEEVESGS
jgi:hypothetical protein